MIIALTGEKLAGKGTIADYLVKQRSAKVLRFSQPLTDILTRLHQPNTRAELVALGTFLRQRFGNDLLAKVVVADAQAAAEQLVIIDGMRYLAEYELCKLLPAFFLLNVTAPVDVRYQRTKQRQEKADEQAMSFAEFELREQDATEQEIKLVQKHASHTIHNIGTITELFNLTDQWLGTLPQ